MCERLVTPSERLVSVSPRGNPGLGVGAVELADDIKCQDERRRESRDAGEEGGDEKGPDRPHRPQVRIPAESHELTL